MTFGTRGDFEPFLSLGSGLAEAGYDVRLASHAAYEPLAADSGVEFAGVGGRSMKEILESEEAQEMMRRIGSPLTLRKRLDGLLRDDVMEIYRGVAAAAEGTDAVLAFPATFPALDVAESTDLPVVQVHHVPTIPTSEFPIAANFAHRRSYGRFGNRFSYTADAAATSVAMRRSVDRAREQVLGMRGASVRANLKQRSRFAGAVVGASHHALRPPSDWPDNAVMCGYWWPRAIDAPAPSDELIEFVATDKPTVFFTLGSMVIDNPATLTESVVGAARDAGVRLVLQRGWSGLGKGVDDDDVFVCDDLSYPEIFDRVDAVVHHGGAGTTALGLLHGRPTLVLPAIADQFFWGHRLNEIGAGPEPLALKKLTRNELAARLRLLVTDPAFGWTTTVLAEAISQEDGPANAAQAIETMIGR